MNKLCLSELVELPFRQKRLVIPQGYVCCYCLFVSYDSLSFSQNFSQCPNGSSWVETFYLNLQGLMCLAQGENVVPPMRLEPATLRLLLLKYACSYKDKLSYLLFCLFGLTSLSIAMVMPRRSVNLTKIFLAKFKLKG